MATTTDCTTLIAPALPLAHSANTDAPGHWSARHAALNALRDARVAAGEPVDVAADYAIAFLDAELEREQAEAIAAHEARKLAAAAERAERKALYHVAGGLDIRQAEDGSYLVPSGTRGGVIHQVSADGATCSCEAGQAGRICWHTYAVTFDNNRRATMAARRVTFPARITLTRAA